MVRTVLSNRTFRHLFAAQVIALLGTGLLTVALGLLAYEMAGERAGQVLGTVLAIKMVAYVALAPLANALAARTPRKALLVGADLMRACVAVALPFVDSVWQVYTLVFILQAASATFTPAFQAAIPDILRDEADYTKALSLSRLAYDLENLLSPVLAGLLLAFFAYHWLFAGTVIGFLGSALLVWLARLPALEAGPARSFMERLTRGARIYLATPRLRGLLALNLSASAVGAFVIVNTVVVVKVVYAGSQTDVAVALAAFGAGSIVAALALPPALTRISDRLAMLCAALILAVVALAWAVWWLTQGVPGWFALLLVWSALGLFYSTILTPSGRLLRRSAHAEDRPAVYSAQFALSHVCWLFVYPIAGWLAPDIGFPATMLVLGTIALLGAGTAAYVWRPSDPQGLLHEHVELSDDHPHLREHRSQGRYHRHTFVIDDYHTAWPKHG